jgi:hypothetical protein
MGAHVCDRDFTRLLLNLVHTYLKALEALPCPYPRRSSIDSLALLLPS